MDTSKRTFLKFTLIGSTFAIGSCNQLKRTPNLLISKGSTVLCIGDSLTFGTGVASEDSYPFQLEKLSAGSLSVLNEGVPGETSLQIFSRLERLLKQNSPALTVITAGGNDFLRNIPEQETSQSIRRMIDLCSSYSSPVILFAVPKPSITGALGSLSDHSVFSNFKALEKVIVLEDVMSSILSTPSLKSDLIHPNGLGYLKMAQEVYSLLKIV